jgi:hypothetical protein
MDHLLLHCEIVNALWSAIFCRVGLSLVMPRRVVDLFACWRGLSGNPQSAAMWKMVSSCLLCCLWREINDRSFEDHKRTVMELNSFFSKPIYH